MAGSTQRLAADNGVLPLPISVKTLLRMHDWIFFCLFSVPHGQR